MARKRVLTGEMKQGDEPDWEPLLKAVGEEVTGDFMWMFEVECSDGTVLHAYKHIDTRGYVHLDADARAFYYESPNRYRPTPLADQLMAVFWRMGELAGVTERQVEASFDAVERAEARSM